MKLFKRAQSLKHHRHVMRINPLLRVPQRTLQKRSFSVKQAQKPLKIGQPIPLTHSHLFSSDLELTPGISKQEYQTRRSNLFSKLQPGSLVVLPSSETQYMTNDIPYLFHQEPNVHYLTGWLEPSSLAVFYLDPQNGPKYHLYVPSRSPENELWTGPRSGPEGAKQFFNCDEAFENSYENLLRHLKPIMEQCSSLMYNPTNPTLNTLIERVKLRESCSVLPSKPLMDQLRWKKSPAEQSLMQKSCSIAANAMVESMKYCQPGMTELELGSFFEFQCKKRGARTLSYPCVVASGENANVLHYIDNTSVLMDGDLILMDAGCELHGYASDITRTFPVNGKWTSLQADLYNLVLEANLHCIKLLDATTSPMRDGKVTLEFLQQETYRIFQDGLLKLGMDISPRLVYPHGIGHHLGMDVHDVGSISSSQPLSEGMVVTIEPGLYMTHHRLIPKKWRDIGIRIEDDVLITKGEPIIMTRQVPKDPHQIESLMNSNKKL